jgi:hypothetical protein
MMAHLPEKIVELEALLPKLKEKSNVELFRKAESLVKWGQDGNRYSDKQLAFVRSLIRRANGSAGIISPRLGNSGEAIDVADIIAKVKAGLDAPQVNTQNIVKQVLDEMEKRVPRQVEISVRRDDGKISKVKGHAHHQFEHLVKAASVRLPGGYPPGIFLQGEASSGKTTGAKMLAEVLKLKWHFNGAISFPHEMLGFIDGAGKYHRTPFREAYEHGGVYTFDEVDRSDPVALLAVNPHLANGVATFPDKQVKRHEDCIIVCTANTWGLGADANYSGATKLDAAFLSRFPVRINWDIDPGLEEKIVGNVKWLERVRKARSNARTFGIKVLIDTRIAQAGAALIEAGYDFDAAAGMTYLANLKPEQRRQIEGGVQ